MSDGMFAIGNPYMSAIDALGLGIAGSYSSTYSSPMMLGIGGMGAYNPYMSGMYGMSGMYNPAFLSQMSRTQQDIERSQLQHSADMHTLLNRNGVESSEVEDRALFERAMVDASVNKGILNLHDKVVEGDQNGICDEFDKLKETIKQKYGDYFTKNSNRINPNDAIINYVDQLYAQIISSATGQQCTLRDDIKKYGQSAFMHGFIKNWRGSDYHEKYSDETISYIYETPLDNKSGKDRMQKYGAYAESAAELAAAGAVGAVALPTAIKVGKGILGTFTPKVATEKLAKRGFAKYFGFNKQVAWIGAIGLAVGDWLWQQSRA